MTLVMHKAKARLFSFRDWSRKPSLHFICALRARPNAIKPLKEEREIKKSFSKKKESVVYLLVEKEKCREQQTNANHSDV